VYVKEGISGECATPAEPVTLDHINCMYEPHVFGVQPGQTLRVRNFDLTSHSTHLLSHHDVLLSRVDESGGPVLKTRFPDIEIMVAIKCDVHGWESACCGVLNHPFFAVTEADGHFAIDDLPAGRYTIEAWHELNGTRTAEIDVADGETMDLDVVFNHRQ